MGVFSLDPSKTTILRGNDEIKKLTDHFNLDVDTTLEEWDSFKDKIAGLDTDRT